jgi:hypothetical protein
MMNEFTFRENPDELHCLQCSLGMAIQATTGEDLDANSLEQITDFTPGLESWPFAAFLALASRGLYVANVEKFNAGLFVEDARDALMQQVGDESVVDRVFEVSDVPRQVALVRQCIDNPRIRFIERIPTLDDMIGALEKNAKLIVNLNSRMLRGADGYAGHLVFVHGYADGLLEVEDPGPPSRAGLGIDLEAFSRAWHSPTEGMANFIAISVDELELPVGVGRSCRVKPYVAACLLSG